MGCKEWNQTKTNKNNPSVIKKQLLEGWRVCFNAEETTFKRASIKRKNMLPIGSIFFPLKVDPMRIDNNYIGHWIEKPPNLIDFR